MHTSLDKPKVEECLSKRENFRKSYVLLAFALYILLDGIFRVSSLPQFNNFDFLKFSPLKVPHRSWVYWNEREFLTSPDKNPPDTALLGSSLMMAALHGGDAVYLEQPQNVAFHHKSKLLADLLTAAAGKPESNFAFALGGEMVSDACILFEHMLKEKGAPQRVIYGIAPRDFMDSALPSVASTEIYRYMSHVSDLSDLEMKARTSPSEKIEYWLGKLSFIAGHKEDFIYIQQRWAKALTEKLLPYKDLDMVKTPLHIRRQAFSELPEDSGANEVLTCPPRVAQEAYEDNLAEYRYRYRKINWKQFDDQLSYLERMLSRARQTGVSVILVNMPLTSDNLAIMPENFYNRYLEKVTTLAERYQAKVLDLNNSQLFPRCYFADSVHLNMRGGKHFFEVLAERLFRSSDPQTKAIMIKQP